MILLFYNRAQGARIRGINNSSQKYVKKDKNK
jgi:hypothetical protein